MDQRWTWDDQAVVLYSGSWWNVNSPDHQVFIFISKIVLRYVSSSVVSLDVLFHSLGLCRLQLQTPPFRRARTRGSVFL